MFDIDAFDNQVVLIEEVTSPMFDSVVKRYEDALGTKLAKTEALYMGEYNSGFGYRYTFSDGSSFDLSLDNICFGDQFEEDE